MSNLIRARFHQLLLLACAACPMIAFQANEPSFGRSSEVCLSSSQCTSVVESSTQDTLLYAAGVTAASPILGATCGNGFPDPGEECDDGNTIGGDGCSPICTLSNLECKPGEPATITTNLVSDPSFELNDGSWAFTGSAFSPLCTPQTCGPDIAPDGFAYLWLAGGLPVSGNQATATQNVFIPIDATTLTFEWSAAFSPTLAECESPSQDRVEVTVDGVQVFRSPDPCTATSGFVVESIDLAGLGLNDDQIHVIEFRGINVDNPTDPAAGFTNIFVDRVSMLVTRDNPDGPTDTVCIDAYCSDSLLSMGEQCDDGNTLDGDGCSSNCEIEQPNWVCTDPNFTTSEFLCAPAADAVTDGSFENDRGLPTDAWNQIRIYQTDPFPICSELNCPGLGDELTSEGVFSAVFRSQLLPSYLGVSQELVIPSGASQLTFDLSVVSCNSENDLLLVEIDGSTIMTRPCDETTVGFTIQTLDITAFADGAMHNLSVLVTLEPASSSETLMIIDNISIPLPFLASPAAGTCTQQKAACAQVETFDAGLPNGWSIINLSENPSDGWGTTNDAVCLSRNAASLPGLVNFSSGKNLTSGANAALCADSDATGQNAEDLLPGSATQMNSYVCSHALDLSTITGPEYTFNAYYQAKDNGVDDGGTPGDSSDDFDSDFLRVLVGTEPPSAVSLNNYQVIYDVLDHDDGDLLLSAGQEIAVNLEGNLEGESEGYVCFQYQGTFAWFAQIDNAALRGEDCALPPVDTDGDGVFDSTDNCTLVPNPDQFDSNNDGIGSACDPDVNNDCIVAFLDIAQFPPVFGATVGEPLFNQDYDFNDDDAINFLDYLVLISYFGVPPGPSANPCVPGLGT